MPKCFSIDFVRQALEQKLFEEHIKNNEYFGGKSQVNIFSFYEQLKTQEQVDRFVETFRDLSEQQNRTGLILNGVVVAPENPTITNLYSCEIIPMSWTCSMRCTLENRDSAVVTIDNLIKQLKGRKVDIAELCCRDKDNHKSYEPFVVGTIGQYGQEPSLKDGDYLGDFANENGVITRFNQLKSLINVNSHKVNWLFYVKNQNKLKVANVVIDKGNTDLVDASWEDAIITDTRYISGTWDLAGEWTIDDLYPYADAGVNLIGDENKYLNLHNGEIEILEVYEDGGRTYTKVRLTFDIGASAYDLCPGWNGTFEIEDVQVFEGSIECNFITDDGTYKDFIFPPEHESFEKYKLSFSFDAIRCDEPRNLNAKEYLEISFSGSSTLVNDSVQLGNDLIKLHIWKKGIQAETPINFESDPTNPKWWLEPLEMPSSNNADTDPIQLASNFFKTNSHTNAIALTLQYSFIYDKSISLLKQWFRYGRYGRQGITKNDISPNMIYQLIELWSSWGEIDFEENKTKLVESLDNENTESDVLTLSIVMQIQGDND